MFFTDAQNTVTSITTNGSPSTYGTLVTYTASVIRDGTQNNNTNKVDGILYIDIDGTNVATFAITNNNNTGKQYSTSGLSAGSHDIDAIFVGSGGASGYNDSEIKITQEVNKATATLTLSNLTQTYDGQPKPVTVTTSPVDLTGVSVTYDGSTTVPVNAGSYAVVASLTNDNYTASDVTGTLVIAKATTTTVVTINGGPFTYTGSAITPATVTVTGAGELSLAPTEVVYTNNINAGTANASYTYAGDDNHFGSSDNEDFEINKRPITIKVDAQSKYCGQIDPALTYKITSGNLVGSDAFNGSLTRDPGESSGTSYAISQGTVALSTNYALTYVGANLTIDGISIDASASSAPVQKGYTASLSALITPTVSGVPVTFVVTNEQDVAVYTSDPSLTTSGIATTTVPADKILTVGVYKVVATAGSGCATSIAYFPVFDPTESFVTGGGWINSPAGALAADASAVGKANFGFVSKYKKGKILTTEVDGNTEFQFRQATSTLKVLHTKPVLWLFRVQKQPTAVLVPLMVQQAINSWL